MPRKQRAAVQEQEQEQEQEQGEGEGAAVGSTAGKGKRRRRPKRRNKAKGTGQAEGGGTAKGTAVAPEEDDRKQKPGLSGQAQRRKRKLELLVVDDGDGEGDGDDNDDDTAKETGAAGAGVAKADQVVVDLEAAHPSRSRRAEKRARKKLRKAQREAQRQRALQLLNDPGAEKREKALELKPKHRDGVTYTDLLEGTGQQAKPGRLVSMLYAGFLKKDGTEFDSNLNRRKPLKFRLGTEQVITGLQHGMNGMRVGGKRSIVVPAELAYGARRSGPIPANADLIFEVELLRVQCRT